jgi:hypothetical protein
VPLFALGGWHVHYRLLKSVRLREGEVGMVGLGDELAGLAYWSSWYGQELVWDVARVAGPPGLLSCCLRLVLELRHVDRLGLHQVWFDSF